MQRLIAIVGATCSGKTTLARHLAERGCAQVITTTTREPRAGEMQGRDYWFVDEEYFDALREQGQLVEEARFGGQSYGVTLEALCAAFEDANDVVAVVTPDGMRALRRWCARHGLAFRSVFLTVKASVLRRRLLRQRPDSATRLRELLEQVRSWPTSATYDLILPGRLTATAADEVLGKSVA